jgi:FkbM family methyltransferase
MQSIVQDELVSYWNAHKADKGEVHLDVGSQIGSYAILAATSGSVVHAIEPDPNNRRFLRRNIKANRVDINVIEVGAWNEAALLSFRSHDAMSSIKGVGMIPGELPALDQIQVDTIDNIVKRFGIAKIDVIKMDIEGAEIEALDGARGTILKDRPTLLIEAYHQREGKPTLGRVLELLRNLGIPDCCICVTDKTLVIAKNY